MTLTLHVLKLQSSINPTRVLDHRTHSRATHRRVHTDQTNPIFAPRRKPRPRLYVCGARRRILVKKSHSDLCIFSP